MQSLSLATCHVVSIAAGSIAEGAMRNTTTLLGQYAACHRDPRNIATHAVGVPLIVFDVGVLLARFGVTLGGWLRPVHPEHRATRSGPAPARGPSKPPEQVA